eukprot:CAMPEP_0180627480 /NCGR_PEP_ID=MMETSP1037_2-20121125/38394_1 /TAXON_ID=632150 /ORGANISM="Azadinium spinosum, Strain 3D9" /LENGTH=128 /DNA_ID=CAMNT_0022648105 /DNA_START=794 /DNA_END=1181 /DNA_ORIENTATION=-
MGTGSDDSCMHDTYAQHRGHLMTSPWMRVSQSDVCPQEAAATTPPLDWSMLLNPTYHMPGKPTVQKSCSGPGRHALEVMSRLGFSCLLSLRLCLPILGSFHIRFPCAMPCEACEAVRYALRHALRHVL